MRIDATAGLAAPALMTVTTQLEGNSAEQMRASLVAETAAELQKRYLNYYARSYPGISVERDMTIEDGQPASGRMTVVEHYRVKDFFAHAEARKRLEASLEVPELAGLLQAPREAIRNAPLALSHPQELIHELELLLPEDWTFENEKDDISDPAFTLLRQIEGGGRRLRIRDHFRSLTGHVLPEHTSAYAANIERARKLLGYLLYKNDSDTQGGADAASLPAAGAGQLNLPLLVLALAAFGAFAFLARRWYAWDPAPRGGGLIDGHSSAGEGLGGPLRLMALGLVINGWYVFSGAWANFNALRLDLWNQFTVAGSAHYHPAIGPLLMTEILASAAQIVGWGLLTLVFFKRRSSAVRIWLIYMWTSVVFALVDQLAVRQIPPLSGTASQQDLMVLVRSFVVVGGWTWHLLVSERVQRTFVRRYDRQDSPAPTAPALPPAGADGEGRSIESPVAAPSAAP